VKTEDYSEDAACSADKSGYCRIHPRCNITKAKMEAELAAAKNGDRKEADIIWTQEALDDFESLKNLLVECERIESANGTPQRLQRIVWTAETLARERYSTAAGALSLFNQLEDGYHRAVKQTPKPDG